MNNRRLEEEELQKEQLNMIIQTLNHLLHPVVDLTVTPSKPNSTLGKSLAFQISESIFLSLIIRLDGDMWG